MKTRNKLGLISLIPILFLLLYCTKDEDIFVENRDNQQEEAEVPPTAPIACDWFFYPPHIKPIGDEFTFDYRNKISADSLCGTVYNEIMETIGCTTRYDSFYVYITPTKKVFNLEVRFCYVGMCDNICSGNYVFGGLAE